MDLTQKKLSISVTRALDSTILIAPNITKSIPTVLSNTKLGSQMVILTHPNLKTLYGNTLKKTLEKTNKKVTIIEIPVGETSKSIETVNTILDKLLSLRLERQDTLIALGGGVIGDLTGFVASIYLRGIHFIQIPTTLLAQVDASIGGKTGINHAAGKNLIGSFYQPDFIFIDPNTLNTLPKRELRCGLAEVIKYGMIMNPTLFDFIEKNQTIIKALDTEKHADIWQHLIYESCSNKIDVVNKDERESGLRAILNFGHTIGHGIEAATTYGTYSHGEAVAIGMKAAAEIAVTTGLFHEKEYNQLITLLNTLGFDLTISNIDPKTILTKMGTDKKIKDGKFNFVLPTKIGTVTIIDDVSLDIIERVIINLKEKQI